jgi:hypothetical protein
LLPDTQGNKRVAEKKRTRRAPAQAENVSAEKIPLSELESPKMDGVNATKAIDKPKIDVDDLKNEIVTELKNFFKVINISILVFMLFAFFIERIFIVDSAKYVVTDKSIIAVITSITIQVGAVYIAAVRGLFSK